MIDKSKLLSSLGLKDINQGSSTGYQWLNSSGKKSDVFSPVDGNKISSIVETDEETYEKIIEAASSAFVSWRKVPAPKRGEIVRQIGNELRENKDSLGQLVSYEMGKSLQEGLGEVQEMIDICDFAVGLSRQLYGLTMHSERPNHRMYEQWHPLGIVGIISAFNFPVAVWAWNTALAWVCGDVCIWKPSEKTPRRITYGYPLRSFALVALIWSKQGAAVMSPGMVLGRSLAILFFTLPKPNEISASTYGISKKL